MGKLFGVADMKNVPGNLLGFRKGTNFAPIANAIDGPKTNPLASIPTFTFAKIRYNDDIQTT